MAYEQVLSLIADTPWAIKPAELRALIVFALTGDQEAEARILAARRTSVSNPQMVGSVAVIPLQGMITPKPGLFSMLLGATSLQDFMGGLAEAVANPDVRSVLIDVDSPGGLVTGVPETAAAVRAARGRKPIVAMVNGDAGSAAYWLAAQAGEIVITPSGRAGSIGVFAAHEDISKALDAAGVKVTLISAGKNKTAGNPYEPLSLDGREHIQSMVDEYNDTFRGDVAKGRGVSAQRVDETYGQGRMFTAHQALERGMVDRVATFEDTVRRMASGQVARGRASADDGFDFDLQTQTATVNLSHDMTPAEARERMGLPALTENQTATETPDAAPAAPADSDTKTLTREDRVRLFKLRA